MGVDENMKYELFVRKAFSGEENLIGRWGDPAHLANTDAFNSGELSEVKAAVSYSMCILNSLFNNRYSEHEAIQQNYARLTTIVQDVIDAPDKMSIIRYIDEYSKTFYDPILGNR